jgi:two-component system nitrogen regulation response regulator GlnG/two-component system response regulator HydG
MPDDCDQTTQLEQGPRKSAVRSTTLTAVICFNATQPDRVGEVAVLPWRMREASAKPLLVGRGGPREDDPAARVRWQRQRPGESEPTDALTCTGLSRQQLLFEREPAALMVKNVGLAPMRVDGKECERALVKSGTVIAIPDQLVLLCVERSEPLPAVEHYPKERFPDFGAPDRDGIVGESAAAWKLRDRIAFAARRNQHVLILGASGSGKELVARALHALSPRAAKRLVARNATTMPEGLIDAELFGNARNYPNPGLPEREGLIGAADGGTLFLDELAEIDAALQAHLLRVLDGGEYHRLGEAAMRRSSFRFVGATNRPSSALKHDLAARLLLHIEVPTLDERREDVPLIARQLLSRAARDDADLAARFFDEQGRARMTSELIEVLLRWPYRTQVRELESLLWRAIADSTGDTVDADDLSLPDAAEPEARFTPPAEITPERIRETMAKHGGVLSRVWQELGLKNRFALRRLMEKHGIRDGRD